MAMENKSSTSRLNFKEKRAAKVQSAKLAKIQERMREDREEMQKRLQAVSTPQWIEQYPQSVLCKNFTQLTDKDYLKASVKLDTKQYQKLESIEFPCIPAIVLPIALDPHDFVTRLFASIDHCVTHLFIYRSGKVKLSDSIAHLNRSLVHNIIFRKRPFPITLSHSWNMAIREMKNVPWYLFCANDVQFAPAQLSALNQQFWVRSGLLFKTVDDIDVAYFNWRNMNSGGYNLFIAKRQVFDSIGTFDENMYPAFFEDADMDRRVELCNRMGPRRCRVKTFLMEDICPWHGSNSQTEYVSGTRSYNEDQPGWDEFIEQAFHSNEAYFRSKWGCSDRLISFENCTYTSPFNDNNMAIVPPPLIEVDSMLRAEDLRFWSLNESRIRHVKSFLVDESSSPKNVSFSSDMATPIPVTSIR
eukprot:CAMPEP_0114429474 /NCGR_PEP_ID=MMETSP0103-20121206/9510_1 /TAXON_ID=37642 ORGANISM="Paraphysomonas imperforata, Strain PA2" /NCGR_SAMPLE_ID=MMETSP0103 /ASSEMBLY_ACC=CAM_ASM_000201 /LENGTH=414 /DNA_ID=CAMNT_0001598823 /DNA_START=288 /DNA_END=1532 /DNA_ORIENTATION=-